MATVSIRYFVTDLDAAVDFYEQMLSFEVELRPSPMFAMLYRGDLRLLLSVPGGEGGGGARMADGTMPAPGGWNRFAIQVTDLAQAVAELSGKGATFRSGVITGVGVKQALLEDPDGNHIELFEPLDAYHERAARVTGTG
jgi:catechol 2,3-dioxygenase-like lactoylglutathione lyase family enzyme